MPALDFQRQFADRVEFGRIKQTIRTLNEHPVYPGDKLYLYSGMQTKNSRLLLTAICFLTREIKITDYGIKVDGQTLYAGSIETLATQDGFESVYSFKAFIKETYGFPFYGQIISWR